MTPRILILGIGNTLMGDDGVGPAVIAALEHAYCFPENVSLIDGGTRAGLLLPYVMACTHLLVLDAIALAEPSGTVYTLEVEALTMLGCKGVSGVHDTTVLHLLAQAELLGARPTVVAAIGVQPQTLGLVPVQLSPPVEAAIPEACAAVLRMLARWGIEKRERNREALWVINAAVPCCDGLNERGNP